MLCYESLFLTIFIALTFHNYAEINRATSSIQSVYLPDL